MCRFFITDEVLERIIFTSLCNYCINTMLERDCYIYNNYILTDLSVLMSCKITHIFCYHTDTDRLVQYIHCDLCDRDTLVEEQP